MNNAEFKLRSVGDPRLAVHATSALPAWLWSVDGVSILWANPVGAKLFGAANGAILAKKTFGPADAHRRQVAQLAGRLLPSGAVRLERLRGFGVPLGALVTCGCARLEFADASHGILIAATEPVGRPMPLVERLQRLVEGIDTPIAAFARDGMFVGASDAARPLLGFRNLAEAGLEAARSDALKQGRVETPIGIGHMVLQRVGTGADVGLVALIAPGATVAAHTRFIAPASPPDYEKPAMSGEAPAEFGLIDEFAPSPEAMTPAAIEPEPAPVTPPADQPTPDYEQPALSGEAPAEFALIDEPEPSPAEPDIEPAGPDVPAEPELMSVLQLDMPHVEASAAQPSAEAAATDMDAHEPSPYVEAVADEPASPAIEAPIPDAIAPPPAVAPSWLDEPPPNNRRHPLRFMGQMDAEGRFSLGSDEFTRLIGARTAAGFGRLWSEIAEMFGLDPDGRVLKAIATRDTWSGVTLNWPVDGDGRLPVELSGLPIYDRHRNFAGYRGFGVCRDLDGLTRLAALRRHEFFDDPAPPGLPEVPTATSPIPPQSPDPTAVATSPPTDLETPVETLVETPKETSKEMLRNGLPFRPLGEPKSPALTPVENSAFNELARQLSARLDNENGAPAAAPASAETPEAVIEPPPEKPDANDQQPGWLAQPEPPARGETRRDRTLLDLLPVGVLIYRLDRLVYANPAFLARMGYASLHALEEAGGLDALYVEPGVSSASSTSDTGTPVTISTQESAEHAARLYTIAWAGEQALALIFSNAGSAELTAVLNEPVAESAPEPVF